MAFMCEKTHNKLCVGNGPFCDDVQTMKLPDSRGSFDLDLHLMKTFLLLGDFFVFGLPY